MAINLNTTYANVTPPDADYPYGSAKNETAPGALDGTPIEKAIYDDVLGLCQSLLLAAGIVPNSNPDTVQAPQYLQAILNTRWYDKVDYAVGTKIVGSDGVTYVCQQATGPGTTVQNPVTESAPRQYWFTEKAVIFGMVHPVGSFYITNNGSDPATLFGVGTWARVQGRFLVGIDGLDADWNTPGETGGSKTHDHSAGSLNVQDHTLTVDEIPAHSHDVITRDNTGSGPYIEDASSGGTQYTGTTQSEGGGQPHNHGISGNVSTVETLPPYYATYIWRRTA